MTPNRIELKRLSEGKPVATLGSSLSSYVSTFEDSRRGDLESSSLAIMDLALGNGAARSSGLVLGQVQSGKTGSIVGVITVARDNGFPLVVVASGSTELLQSQTLKRLREKLTNQDGQEDWIIQDKLIQADTSDLNSLLAKWAAWQRGALSVKPPTAVIAPLKTAGLQKTADSLAESFTALSQDFPLLIVDDESDSATPNTKSRKNLEKGLDERSVTSRRMQELYHCSEFSKYIMYTATPQANLLQQIDEVLNPDYAYILEPGPGYMGLHHYFLSSARNHHLRKIPTSEVINERTSEFPEHETAVIALATFVVGCAIQLKTGRVVLTDNSHVRSMMMQVAQTKEAHRHFHAVAKFRIQAWKRSFQSENLDHEDVTIFEEAALDLGGTNDISFTFGQLKDEIKTVLGHVRVVLMNSENRELRKDLKELEVTDRVKWTESRFWILIGGIFMDRGFTVEGIQVTFMPRKPALNEDSITQRGRFFGYHQNYLEYIRLFMPDALHGKYIDIAENAADLRKQVRQNSTHISKWIRNFRVSKGTSPTRKSVIGRDLASSSVRWLNPEDLHQVNERSRGHNIEIVRGLLTDVQKSGAKPAPGSAYKVFADEKALIFEDIPLVAIHERLAAFEYAPESNGLDLLSRQIEDASAIGFKVVTLIFIDHLRTENLRGKNLDPIGPIGHLLWSGRSRFVDDASGDYKYPNDREIFNQKQPTVQVRLVKSNPFDDSSSDKRLFAWWAWINPVADDRLKERK